MTEEDDLRERVRSMPVVYELPGMDQVQIRDDLLYKTVDGAPLYATIFAPPGVREPGQLLPAVLFVGRQQALYTCWEKLVAASGMMAMTFDFSPMGYYEHLREPEQDVLDLLDLSAQPGPAVGH